MKFAYRLASLVLLAAPALALDKQQTTQEMLAIAGELRTLKADPAAGPQIARLEARYRRLSQSLGGDDPAAVLVQGPQPSLPPSSFLIGPPPSGCSSTTTGFSNTTPAPITDLTVTSSQLVVSGMGTSLWDVDLLIEIQHTYAADLDITLTAPDGTVIGITSDNGGANDDVFDGTRFDDQSANPVWNYVFTNLVTATNLSPEFPLSQLRGIDPNGTWTLDVYDDANIDVGTLVRWSVEISDLSGTPSPSPTMGLDTTPLPIADLATQASTITIAGAPGTLLGLDLMTMIQHTYAADLDITLTSPAGTIVTITTDNGGANDDVFHGTLWSDGAVETCNDYVYTNFVAAPLLIPEGHMDRFLGENPNGVWTLTITDDAAIDTGTLHSWSLDIRSGDCGGGSPPVAYCSPGLAGVIACPCGNPPSGANRGCDNSSATGGATIGTSGTSSLSGDTLVFATAAEKPSATSILLQGNAALSPGLAFGQGVRCVGGALKRLYVKTASGGSISAPGPGDLSVSARSASLGDAILAGSHRYYMVYYRDPIVLGGCAATSTYNATSALDATWTP